MITEEYKAYLAAMVDGEGWIILVAPSGMELKKPRVGIAQKNQLDFLQELKVLYGGGIRFQKRYPGNASWVAESREDILKFLKDIYPYLRFKKARAEIAIAICELMGDRSQSRWTSLANKVQRMKLQEKFHQVPGGSKQYVTPPDGEVQ